MTCSPDSNFLLVEDGGVAGDDEEQAVTLLKEFATPNDGGVNIVEYLLPQRHDLLLTDLTDVKQAE